MRLLVDVYDASGTTRLGDGPITTCLSASVKRTLDAAGTISISVPYEDKRAYDLLQLERQVWIYIEQENANEYPELRLFGQGIIRTRKTSAGDQGIVTTFTGPDILDALTRYTVRLNRSYENQSLQTICDDLIGLVPGWAVVFEDAATAASLQTARFAGASVIKALLRVVEEKGLHLRLSSTTDRTIEIGAFGTDTGLLLTNTANMTRDIQRNRDIILVEDVSETENTRAVVNRVIPIGAGEGQAALTLKNSTRTSPYTIQSSVEPDGTTVYYLEDAASVALYGVIEKVVTFKQIAPTSNSTAAKGYAANALYDAASAWLQRNSQSVKTYTVKGVKHHTTLQAGDTIWLRYIEEANTAAGVFYPLNIDETLWIMGVTEQAGESGISLNLDVSTVDVVREDGKTIVVGALETLQAQNVAIATYPFWSENTYSDHIQASSSPSDSSFKRAIFKLEVDNSIVDLVKVRIRFKTYPFFTTALVTTSVVWDGKLTGYLLNHYNYPYQMALEVDGVDVTSAMGGPWGDGVSGVDVTLDITQYIVEASGGLYQDHSIEFVPTARNGQAEYPGYGSVPVTALASSGRVELNIRVQGVCQAILPN